MMADTIFAKKGPIPHTENDKKLTTVLQTGTITKPKNISMTSRFYLTRLVGVVRYSCREKPTKHHSKNHKEVQKMDKSFFNLPKSTKALIWEALLARWAAKKPATR